MNVQPYLFFEGSGEEAIAFYRQAVGAEVLMLMHYKESPDQGDATRLHPEKIMHATLKIGQSTVMLSDGHCSGKPAFNGLALSLIVRTEAEAHRAFTALAEGGAVAMPLAKTFFAPQFGMLTDRFGLMWMVMVEA
jgi:PhnB protein